MADITTEAKKSTITQTKKSTTKKTIKQMNTMYI